MENFIASPNLPEGKVSLFVVDKRITKEMEEGLSSRGARLIKTDGIDTLYEAISCHPDIMLHHLGGNKIVVAPNIPEKTVLSLEKEGFEILEGKTVVEGKYPLDVAYNAARVGKNIICNTDYTDNILIKNFVELGLNIIHIKQGYAKCSLCVVNENAVITSDRGMHNILSENGIDSLLITPGHIDLFQMNYGFIGGASGFISGNDIGFYGNICLHPEYKEIKEYLKKHGKFFINLSENRLLDLGTLIPLKEYSILMP